jgi:phage shock protein A
MSDFEVSDVGTIEKLQVRIGRLEKKIKKLKQQRDHFKERHDHYAKVLEMQPYLERRYESYTDRIKREELNRQNAKTVIEQSKLIEMLMKENEQLRNQLTDATKV